MIKIPVFITVRQMSSRLSNKCFKQFGSKSNVIEWVYSRVCSHSQLMPIICTGNKEKNEEIINFATKNNIQYFSGPENNKVKRWFMCAKHFNFEKFHTLDCDDPFFDPERIIESMEMLNIDDTEIILPSDYSDNGAATEGFSIKTDSLKFTSKLEDSADTEMCYSYLSENLKAKIISDPDYQIKNIRLTLDYEEDYNFLLYLSSIFDLDIKRRSIETFIKENYEETPNFSCNELWKNNQNSITKETYENFSRTK